MRTVYEGALTAAQILAVLVFLGALAVLFGGCSGATLPVVTVPITVHCSWSVGATSGGEVSETETGEQQERHANGGIVDSDCIVEDVSPTTSPTSTGQSTTTGDISPSLETDVSATGG